MISVRVDGVLEGPQRESLLELPDLYLKERLLESAADAVDESDVLVVSSVERIPADLNRFFPSLKLLVHLGAHREEEGVGLAGGVECVSIPHTRQPVLADWIWSHLLGMRWHVGHAWSGRSFGAGTMLQGGALVLSGRGDLVAHVAQRAQAWNLPVSIPGESAMTWRDALRGGGTFCLLDEAPVAGRELDEEAVGMMRRGAVVFAPLAIEDVKPVSRALIGGHLAALAYGRGRQEPEAGLIGHPGFYPLGLEFETLMHRTFSPEEGLARVIADYFNV